MGFYIEVDSNRDKATKIVAGGALAKQENGKWAPFGAYAAEIVPLAPASFGDIPEDKALIVVVDNGLFEAAGYAYDDIEFAEFTNPRDRRPRTFVIMDKHAAEECSGRAERIRQQHGN